ncbi:MAG: HPr(Ser) kinase/phosphatase [Kiritimatiellia bacterium]
MDDTPVRTAGDTPFTLRDFVEAGRERLGLEVVVGGAGLDHEVQEPMSNRPGLALTGYYGFFAKLRIQVIGQAEWGYLESLPSDVRLERVQQLFVRGAYCLVFACGMDVPADMAALAEQAGAVVLRTPLLTREYFHQSTFILERLRAPTVKLYATTVEVAGLGVMLEGAPGLGKSETALGLIKHGNALIADDLTFIRKDVAANRLFASACEATRNYMEIRGLGIIHVPSVFGVTSVCAEKRLDLVITLKGMAETEGELDRAGEDRLSRTILGVDVPQLVIPVAAGRDLVNLVETAAQQYKLLAAGHDAVKELDARLRARAMTGTRSI